MALQDKNIDPKILEFGKEEFLNKGFEKASIRNICRSADVTTGAFYTRYKNKDELFLDIVSDTLDKINTIMYSEEEMPTFSQDQDGKVNIGWLLTSQASSEIMNFIYDNYDDFSLLLCCSNGSSCENFLHIFIDKSTEVVFDYFNNIKDVEFELVTNKEQLHLIYTSFWTAMFEPVVHEFSREQAIDYSKILSKFFNFEAIINIDWFFTLRTLILRVLNKT